MLIEEPKILDLKEVTVIMAYYENHGMLKKQIQMFNSYDKQVRDKLTVYIGDDTSPRHPAINACYPLPDIKCFRLYKMKEKINWGQDAIRNLLVKESKTDYVLLTDIDHLISEEAIIASMQPKLNSRFAYRFSRVSAPDLEPYKHHPNSWLMSRKMYWDCGGYDERFCGVYGTDGPFSSRVKSFAAGIVMLKEHLIRVPREVISDASTSTLTRKSEENSEKLKKIKEEIQASGMLAPVHFTRKYEQLI